MQCSQPVRAIHALRGCGEELKKIASFEAIRHGGGEDTESFFQKTQTKGAIDRSVQALLTCASAQLT